MFRPKMNVYKNWNKDFYIAPKIGVVYDDFNNEIVNYDEPIFLKRVNYQPLSNFNYLDNMVEFGEKKDKMVCALIDYIDDYKIKPFDLAYLYGATPDNEEKNGANANYIVKSKRMQNSKIAVLLEELTDEEVLNYEN